jgi:hypothetical protein
MNRPPIEPHADMRTMAATCRQMYEAWKEVGFTQAEAFQLLRDFVANMARPQPPSEG